MEAPIENQIHRRKFIKGIFITALIAGLNPLDTISACELNSGDDLLAILADAKAEYQKFMRQISNSNKLDTLSQEEARIQDVGLLKLIAVGSDKDFPKYSKEKKINKLKDAKAFQPKNKVSESERQKIMRELMFSAEMTFDASAFAYVGTTAIVGSTIKVLNLINPAYKVILTVPRWAKITHAIMGGLVAIRRGWNEFESRARSSSASSAEVLKSSIYDKYLSSSDFKFETKIPNFKYTVSNTDLKPNDAFRDSDFKDPDLKEVMLWMRDRLSQTDIFANKKELESFLDGYLDKIGKIQEESIKNVLDAYKKADEVALSKQRDKAALFDSIQNFVGNAILSNVAAPKEAAILNTLMGVGFQLAMGASFGPVGDYDEIVH